MDPSAWIALGGFLFVVAGALAGAGYAWGRVVHRLDALKTLDDLPGRVQALEFSLTAQKKTLDRIEECLMPDTKSQPISLQR